MPNAAPSDHVRLIREHDRARYDRETIDSILDAGLVAHLGFTIGEQPFVIPTLHARVDDRVYIHGSAASRALRSVERRVRACLTVTHIDGIVLARSAFEHDVNYRSVVLVGEMAAVDDEDEKLVALEAFMERLIPGRWDEARRPSRKELKATSIVAMPIEQASAKVRSGGAEDGDSEDAELDIWAGQIPISAVFGEPIADPDLKDGIPVSPAALAFIGARDPAR